MSIYRLRTEFGQHFKYVLIGIAVIFVIGAMYTFGAAPGDNKRNDPGSDKVVAVINGAKLTKADWDAQREQMEREARDKGIRSPLQYAGERMKLFQGLVQTQSALQLADQMGVDVSNDKVNKEIDKAITQYLNANRQKMLGKLTEKQKAIDPRDDADFKKQLASVGQSIDQMEAFVRSQVPESSIKANLAIAGIQKKMEAEAGRVSDKEIEDSYKVYNLRQILMFKGKLPQSQLMSKANKIVSAAKSGTDFVTLVKNNTDIPTDKKTGGQMKYSFENQNMFPVQLRTALEKMKPGDVSKPVDLGSVIYIVKLDNISSETPANLDKKTRDARIKEIKQSKQMSAMAEVSEKMNKNLKIEVRDPELLAYWSLIQGQQVGPEGAQQSMKRATAALKRAVSTQPNNIIAKSMLAQLYFIMGKNEEARNTLYPMLEGKTAITEGGDLRILLGDILLKQNKKEDAIKQYQTASEVSQNDKSIHEQLKTKFVSVGRTDLAAAEDKWIKDYDLRMAQWEARNNKGVKATTNTPAKAPKPSTPKSGG